MDSRKLTKLVNEQLDILEDKGHQAVSIEGLRKYLDGLSEKTSDSKEVLLAQYNAQHQSQIEQYKESKAEWRELFKAVVTHAQSAIKLQALINGGAAVALLAFIGKVWTPEFSSSAIADYIPVAIILYCFGVGSAALTQSFSYASQHYFTYDQEKIGVAIRIVAQVTAFSSLVLFFVATYIAYLGFVHVPGKP